MFSLHPSVFGLASPCMCWWKDRITWLCALHTCVTWSAKSLSFFPSCTSSFLSLVSKSISTTHPRFPTTNLISSNSRFRPAGLSALMMLLYCSFASASFTSRNRSSLSVDCLNSKIYTICRASSITLCGCVFLFTSPYTCTLCPMFSLYPSVFGFASPCTCWWKDRITRLCALHTYLHPSHMIGEESVILPFLYIRLFDLGVEVVFNDPPTRGFTQQIQSTQIPASEQLVWAHWWCFCTPHLLLLLSLLGTALPCLLTV